MYRVLGYDKSQWARWYSKNIIQNDFCVEHIDYEGFDTMSNGNIVRDFAITVDFAKRLSMMARTESGEQARQYFIECERRAKTPITNLSSLDIARMLVAAEEEKEALRKQFEIDAPKVLFANAVSESKDTVLIKELATYLNQNGVDIGQNRLFIWLRENGYLCSKGESYNLPTQRALDLKLFEVKKTAITKPNGTILTTTTTKATGKALQYFLNKFLAA